MNQNQTPFRRTWRRVSHRSPVASIGLRLHLPPRQNRLRVQGRDLPPAAACSPCSCQQRLRPVGGVGRACGLPFAALPKAPPWRAVLAPGSRPPGGDGLGGVASETLPPQSSHLSFLGASWCIISACPCVFSCFSRGAFCNPSPTSHVPLASVPEMVHSCSSPSVR